MDVATAVPDCAAGTLPMAERIRAFDWAATGLGPMEDWPAHLRASVDLMLAHGFPMIVLWGPSLIQLYNDGYAEIMQDKHPAGLGQPTSVCWPEVWHINGPIYDRVLLGETVTYRDKLYPLARPTGLQDTWFTITYSPIRGSDGAIGGVLVTMFDTSAGQLASRERDLKEAELRASEQRLALAFKLLPVGAAVVDRSGRAVMSNDMMRTYMPSDRIPSRDDANVARWRGWHADGRPIAREDFSTARALRGETVVPGLEFLFTHDDGRECWTRITSAPILGSDGEVTGAFSIVVDIDELKRASEALRVKEERFRQFAAASLNVLWIRSADTLRMEFVSPAFDSIYGVAGEEGQALRDWAALVVPDDRAAVLDAVERVRAGQSVSHAFRIRRPDDGGFRWIQATDFPLFDADGRVGRIAGIATDVTESHLASEHQQVLLAELQHRVRNTMAMISSLVTRSRGSTASVDEYAELLAGRLRSLARTQALLTRAANAGVDIRTIVDDELKAQAHRDSQYAIDGPPVLLSPKATEVLSLAIHELTTNALKYGALACTEGRVAVRWETGEENGQAWVRLHWQERCGAATRPAVPERQGFGTMLIEKRVPYELGGRGRLEIGSDGASALIEFPLTERSSAFETLPPVATDMSGGGIDLRGEAGLEGIPVLLMEDEFYLAHDLAAAFESAGAIVQGPFSEAAVAATAICERPPACAVIDINLGTGADFSVAAALDDARIPFVFLTGYDAAAIPARYLDVPRLEKPARPLEVLRAVRLALARRPADDGGA